jgi:N-hydroxyarylamine O-acetyltransferase
MQEVFVPADMLDLNAYLARIGLPDLGRPSLETLRALVAHHAAAIPFENLDVVLGRPVPLEPAAIQSKLVRRKRGGYCFEHNTLLHTVLRRLGFDAVMLMGRVVLGADETAERPRTHAFVQVRLPEGTWLADVGFGNLTPTTPLSLAHQETQATPHEAYRVRQRDHGLVLQVWLHDDWRPVYRFTLEPTLPIDHVVANWFTSTCPGGMFTSNLVVAMPAQGCRKTLFNGLLKAASRPE